MRSVVATVLWSGKLHEALKSKRKKYKNNSEIIKEVMRNHSNESGQTSADSIQQQDLQLSCNLTIFSIKNKKILVDLLIANWDSQRLENR